jgi:hypothetical protein
MATKNTKDTKRFLGDPRVRFGGRRDGSGVVEGDASTLFLVSEILRREESSCAHGM